MNRIFSIIIIMFAWASTICGASKCDGYNLQPHQVTIEREGSLLAVGMSLDLQTLEVSNNRAVVITPVLRNGSDYQELRSVGVYGKRRYIQYQRIYGGMVTGENEISFKASKAPANYVYYETVPFQGWMKGAVLELHVEEYGCCRSVLCENTNDSLATLEQLSDVVFRPTFIVPKNEAVKHRSLAGRANVDFPVNKTVIYPDYRRNPVELAKIRTTIDSIKGDADITVKALSLKGYASPESSWENNTRLAKGRTQALKDYVMNLYHFTPSSISTDYEPEDWAGLKAYVETSTITNKESILAIINSNMDPDAKEAKLKAVYPQEYRYLLDNVYPGLRHCDYVVEYDIRSYSDVKEIAQVFKVHPQKLSLSELYMLANTYQSDSQEYADVFETAARMYPSDAGANLNAANCAIMRGDLGVAERYLEKAGDTPQVAYAKGIIAAKRENKAEALRLLSIAQAGGVVEALSTIEYINKFK